MKDLANNVNVTQSIVPIVLAADANGASADLQGYESATIILDVGIEGITLSTSNKIEFDILIPVRNMFGCGRA